MLPGNFISKGNTKCFTEDMTDTKTTCRGRQYKKIHKYDFKRVNLKKV